MKNIIVSWSSGKDSMLTLERLLESNRYNVVGLYTTHVNGEVPFQVTPLNVVQMQADALGLPLVTIELPEVFPSNLIYQQHVINGLRNSLINIDAVAFGDMFCNGIVDYRKSYIEPAGYEAVFPLLGEDSRTLANEILNRNIDTRLVTVDSNVLSRDLCGEIYSKSLIGKLPDNVDPCGENGEFHTLVCNSRYFANSITLSDESLEHQQRFTHLRYSV
jgi:uncharacterized protein (TIGR00290 family)